MLALTGDKHAVGLRVMLASIDHVGAEADDAFQPHLQVIDVRLASRQAGRFEGGGEEEIEAKGRKIYAAPP